MTSNKRPDIPVPDAVAWEGTSLRVVDPAVHAWLTPVTLSPSTMKEMAGGCPAKWLVKRQLPRGGSPFESNELGDSAHSVLEELYKLPPELRTPDQAMLIVLALSKEKWPGKDQATFAKRGRWIAEVYKAYELLWDLTDPTAVTTLATEMRLDGIEIDGIPLKGFIDRVEQDADGAIRLVDTKTGKVPANITRFGDDHGDQMRIYSLGYAAFTGITPAALELQYTRFGKSRTVPAGPSYMRKVRKTFETGWETLNVSHETSLYATKPGPLCGWCPAVQTCPAAAGREAKIAVPTNLGIPVLRAPTAAELGKTNPNPPVAPPRDDDLVAADYPPEYDQVSVPGLDEFEALAAVLNPDTHNDRTPAMTAPTTTSNLPATVPDGKPFEEKINGAYNLASSAASSAFGLTSLAYAEVVGAGLQPSKDLVTAAVRTFEMVIAAAQQSLVGSSDWQSGAHTRLQGAFRAYLDTHPAPFGGTGLEWKEWVEAGSKHVGIIASMALQMWAGPHPATPWVGIVDPKLALDTITKTTPAVRAEGQRYLEIIDGEFNLASWAASSVFGLTCLAYTETIKAGLAPSRARVLSVARTFSHIVETVEVGTLSGSLDWQSGEHTRLQGALRTYMEANPAPFGQEAEAWETWATKGIRAVRAVSTIALTTWTQPGSDVEPWAALAGSPADTQAA